MKKFKTTLLTAAFIGASLSFTISAVAADKWVSPLHRDHPLVDKIWQPAAQRFVERSVVEAIARKAGFVMLGESHNNIDHHRLQAELVKGLISAGRKPAIVFEMVNEDRQSKIDQWRATHPKDAAGLGPALDWARSGWPEWSVYQPIADAGLAAGLPLLAGNPARDLTRKVSREGFEALGAKRRARLRLDTPLPAKAADVMREELYQSHCKLIPVERLSPLISVQRIRDAVLADNLITAFTQKTTRSAILIAGSGHARRDHGVPWHISVRDTDAKSISISFLQVRKDATKPEAYSKSYGGKFPFDFVWFTPRADARDRCAELRVRFQKGHGKRKAKP